MSSIDETTPPVKQSKPVKHKLLWVSILTVGALMIVSSISFLIVSLTAAPSGGNSTEVGHRAFINILESSIEKTKTSGLTETTVENYSNEDGNGTMVTYKYFDAATEKGASCINDCSVNVKAEDYNATLTWLKLVGMQKTHTQYYIEQIDANTFKVKYASDNSLPETWIAEGDSFTQITGTVNNSAVKSEWITTLLYEVDSKGLKAISIAEKQS